MTFIGKGTSGSVYIVTPGIVMKQFYNHDMAAHEYKMHLKVWSKLSEFDLIHNTRYARGITRPISLDGMRLYQTLAKGQGIE